MYIVFFALESSSGSNRHEENPKKSGAMGAVVSGWYFFRPVAKMDETVNLGDRALLLPEKLIQGLYQKVQQKGHALSLGQQMMTIFGTVLVVLALCVCVIVYSELKAANQHQADSLGSLLSEQTANAATDMLVTGDRLSLNVLLSQLTENPYVARAAIYSIDNREIASSESDEISERGGSYSSPIHYQDVIAGYVRLRLDKGLLVQTPRSTLTLIVVTSILSVLLGAFLLYSYASWIVLRIKTIQRQLISISPTPPPPADCVNELRQLSWVVEQQLTERGVSQGCSEPGPDEEKVSAIVSVNCRNLPRLRKLLAPQDLVSITKIQGDILASAAQQYQGDLQYAPDGTAFIRFSSENSADFTIDAMDCALLIQSLQRLLAQESMAGPEVGIGLCISDAMGDYPYDIPPFQTDNAASCALMLASMPEAQSIHIFRSQLSWLPADQLMFQVSEHSEDIVEVAVHSSEQLTHIQQHAKTVLTTIKA